MNGLTTTQVSIISQSEEGDFFTSVSYRQGEPWLQTDGYETAQAAIEEGLEMLKETNQADYLTEWLQRSLAREITFTQILNTLLAKTDDTLLSPDAIESLRICTIEVAKSEK